MIFKNIYTYIFHHFVDFCYFVAFVGYQLHLDSTFRHSIVFSGQVYLLFISADAAGVCWPLESGGGAAAAAGGLHCGPAQLRGGITLPDAAMRERSAGGGEAFAVSVSTGID